MSDDYDTAADSYGAEIALLKQHVANLLRQLEDVPVKHPQQFAEREAARADIT